MRIRRSLLGCLAVALAAPVAAHAATLTEPAADATVGLTPTFSWSEGPNEVLPSVTVARTPSYDTETLTPICSAADDTDRTTTCTAGFPLAGGTWYGGVQTRDVDTDEQYSSPFVRFTVRYMLGFANTDPWGTNPALNTDYVPHPLGIGPGKKGPFSSADVGGWLNDPGAKVAISYTLKHGRKVVKRVHHSRSAGPDEDWSFGDQLVLRHIRGIANGTRLHCAIAMTGDGVSARRTTTLRNPPPRR